MTHPRSIALALFALALAACGGTATETTRSGTPAAQAIVVATSPAEADVVPGGTVDFGAQVTGTANASVTWQVVEPDGGTVDAAGRYTAPATEGTFHVRATSAASSKSTGSSVVRVKKGALAPAPPEVAISLSPSEVILDACGTRAFAATVTGATNGGVTWTVTEAGGGTVAGGAYVAPSSPGTYHVVATSQADPAKVAVATVTVGPEKVLSVAVTPGSGAVLANGTLSLAALVTTSCGTFAAQ